MPDHKVNTLSLSVWITNMDYICHGVLSLAWLGEHEGWELFGSGSLEKSCEVIIKRQRYVRKTSILVTVQRRGKKYKFRFR